MKRDIVLLMVMVLFVVSIPDGITTQSSNMNPEPMNFVLSQSEMPIYELVTPAVNETYVQSLASSLFGIHDVVAQEAEGIYFVNWSNSYLEVDSTDGSIWFADYDRIWNVSLGDDKPNQTESQSIAEAWLEEKGLIPANAEFAGIGTTNMTIFNPVTEAMHSKIINYHFNYAFAIDDIPITEESAQITVMIGESSDMVSTAQNIVGFDWRWRDIKSTAYTTAVLIEFDSIMSTYGFSADDVVEYSLVYDTGEDDSNNDLLVPVYDVKFAEADSDGAGASFHLKFDATEFDPQVQIIQPADSITVQPGTPVTFDCSVIFGTPPYAYQWYSHVDGVLFQSATTSSFTTSTLTEAIKSNIAYPHSISVLIKDSEDRYSRDEIAVKIDSTAVMSIDMGIVLIGLGAVFLLSVFLILAKKRGAFVLLFLLMFLSAFILLPVASASSGVEQNPVFQPSAPTGAYDDGIKEVGIEWIGLSYHSYDGGDMLTGSQSCSEGFYNHMGSVGGYSLEFNWGEYGAWESDFRDVTINQGNDSQWIDAVDMVYYQGHGGTRAVSFTSNHDDDRAYFAQMKLGDGDLDTIAFDSCSVLAWYDPYVAKNVFERWGPTLQGVHQVCGFATGAKNTDSMGLKFAQYMTGLYPLPALTIMESWFRAAVELQPSDRKVAMFYGTNSTNPFQPQLDDPINDHAKGFGYVCEDPIPSRIAWYVYIWTSC
jgi:hypothetical protein